jgi:hypothetical protein
MSLRYWLLTKEILENGLTQCWKGSGDDQAEGGGECVAIHQMVWCGCVDQIVEG